MTCPRIFPVGNPIADTRHVHLFHQDITLFNNTIYHNIAYGRIDASPEEVYNAARRAQIHEVIMSLPDKYKTKVGERGLMLSGEFYHVNSLTSLPFIYDPKLT